MSVFLPGSTGWSAVFRRLRLIFGVILRPGLRRGRGRSGVIRGRRISATGVRPSERRRRVVGAKVDAVFIHQIGSRQKNAGIFWPVFAVLLKIECGNFCNGKKTTSSDRLMMRSVDLRHRCRFVIMSDSPRTIFLIY